MSLIFSRRPRTWQDRSIVEATITYCSSKTNRVADNLVFLTQTNGGPNCVAAVTLVLGVLGPTLPNDSACFKYGPFGSFRWTSTILENCRVHSNWWTIMSTSNDWQWFPESTKIDTCLSSFQSLLASANGVCMPFSYHFIGSVWNGFQQRQKHLRDFPLAPNRYHELFVVWKISLSSARSYFYCWELPRSRRQDSLILMISKLVFA